MKKGKAIKHEKRKSINRSGGQSQETSMSDYLAAAPGMLMCFMVVVMLILDISVEGMLDRQYQEFQTMFRVLNIAAIVAGFSLIVYEFLHRTQSFTELRSKSRHSAIVILWGLFLLWILISTAINGLTSEALHGIPYRNIGVFHQIAFVVIYIWASSEIKRESFRRDIIMLYIIAADAIAIATVYDHYVDIIAAFHEKKELSAIFFNGNHYGYFLLMAILLGIGLYLFGNGRRAVFGAISASLNAMVLVINHSMGSIVAVLAVTVMTCIYIALRDKRRINRMLIMIAASAVLIAVAFAISADLRKELMELTADLSDIITNNANGSTGHNRIKVWRLTADYISARPLFGYGCEGMSMDLYAELAISNPHNEFLTLAAYYGIPAAVLYAAAVITTLTERVLRTDKNIWSAVSCMAAAGYFISSATGVAMFYISPFFYIFMGLSMTVKTKRL